MEVISNLIRRRYLPAVFIFLFSFALFTPSLVNDFVWDDVEVISKSQVSFDTSNIISVIVPPVENNKKARYYRPVVYASMVADKGFWGVSPFGFHLSNLLFFSISAVLLYFMVLAVLRGFNKEFAEPAAFVSALIFAVHPIHVESVSWIAGRTDVLCGLFFFLAVLCHVVSHKHKWVLILTALSISLALLSKEVAVTFVALVLVYDLLSGQLIKRSSIVRYPIYIALLILYFYLRGRAFVNIPEIGQAVISGAAPEVPGSPEQAQEVSNTGVYFEALKTVFNSTLMYINKLVFPNNLNAFISVVPKEIYYTVAASVLAVVLTTVSFLSIKRKENVAAFSILWVLITLSPSLLVAVYPIASTPMAERYLFIPSAGLCLLLGYLLIQAGRRVELRKLAWAIGIIIVAVFSLLTVQRQFVWQDDLSLWRDATLKSPYDPLPHTNYGLALSNTGAFDGAIREYKIALLPEMGDSPRGKSVTANNLGLVYIEREDYSQAESWFNRAREFDPSNGRTYYHLGLIFFIKGELGGPLGSYAQSEKYLRQALNHYYSFGKANLLLAKIYLKQGEIEKAKHEARIAVRSGLPEALLDQARDILKVDDERSDQ